MASGTYFSISTSFPVAVSISLMESFAAFAFSWAEISPTMFSREEMDAMGSLIPQYMAKFRTVREG